MSHDASQPPPKGGRDIARNNAKNTNNTSSLTITPHITSHVKDLSDNGQKGYNGLQCIP